MAFPSSFILPVASTLNVILAAGAFWAPLTAWIINFTGVPLGGITDILTANSRKASFEVLWKGTSITAAAKLVTDICRPSRSAQ